MKKFGFSRKGDDGDDPNRSALFSRKKSSPAPSDNPYAQQKAPPNDPYTDTAKYANMTPYQQARAKLPSEPRPQQPGAGHPSPQPAQPAGYGSDRYGSGGGYGANRYDNQNSGPGQYNSPAPGARGPGGYGGFGGPTSRDEPDENRDALFSGAQERNAQRQPQRMPPTSAPDAYGQPGSGAGGGADASDSYGDYGQQRELTAEEQEEADVQAILQEKRQVQQDSADSLARSEQMAQQATEVGRATLARLGAQGERLYNTEMHLNMAANQNKAAQQKTAELKTLNRSMFAVHVGNPFTSKARQQRADEDIIERHQTEREDREATRRANYASTQRMENNFKDVDRSGRQQQQQQARKKDYGKFNLEDEDEGANELEDQIDDRIDRLGNHVGTMNVIGRAIGAEVDAQNSQLNRIMAQVCARHGLLVLAEFVANYVAERSCFRRHGAQQGTTWAYQVERPGSTTRIGGRYVWPMTDRARIWHLDAAADEAHCRTLKGARPVMKETIGDIEAEPLGRLYACCRTDFVSTAEASPARS